MVEPSPLFGPRRPLMARGGGIGGFQIALPAHLQARVDRDPEGAPAQAWRTALLAGAVPVIDAGRSALLSLPAAALQREPLLRAVPSGLLLCVPDLAELPAATASALRARGVRLAMTDAPPRDAPSPDAVVLTADSAGLDTLLLSAQRWREAWPSITVIATGLQHLDDVERALRADVQLASGELGRSASTPPRRELGAAAHRICELINHLALDRDLATLGETVRADVALTYRLLRYANSPAIGLRSPVETPEQAVQVLGRQELQRWLTMQLLGSGQARLASRALQEVALARGKLLELLGRHRDEPDAAALFTVGLLSLIEPLLQVPMADALAPLRLGDEVAEALLHGRGRWAGHLQLLAATDAGDLAGQQRVAEALGVAEVLEEASDAAWAWAAAAAG